MIWVRGKAKTTASFARSFDLRHTDNAKLSSLNKPSHLKLGLLLLGAIWSCACDPRTLPGFKEESERQEERITRETEAAIRESPQLRELNQLCIETIPRPSDFVLVNKFRTLNSGPLLGYGYHSAWDYDSVKSFYLTSLPPNRWHVITDRTGGWRPSKIEFRKDSYTVRISESGLSDEHITYFLECSKQSQ